MVIELVSLRLKPGIDEAAFLAAAEAAMDFLGRCPGFRGRRLARDGDGWIDLVDWASLDEALAAARQFNQQPATAAFNACIQPGSVTMRHLTVGAAFAEEAR